MSREAAGDPEKDATQNPGLTTFAPTHVPAFTTPPSTQHEQHPTATNQSNSAPQTGLDNNKLLLVEDLIRERYPSSNIA